jgi:hypothetical protein
MNALDTPSVSQSKSGALAGWVIVLAVLVLAWASWQHHGQQLCVTQEWPAAWLCSAKPETPQHKKTRLLEQIRVNPGDSSAWIELANLAREVGEPSGLPAQALLEQATRLAPEDRLVQSMQAVSTYAKGDKAQAVRWLIRLVQDNQDNWAASKLALLMQDPQAVQAMMPHVQAGERWLTPVVDAMRQTQVPVVHVMPLVIRALNIKALSPALALQLLTELKTQGNWLEAHAVWTAWLGRAVTLIYNGDFEEPIMDAGLDWEFTPVQPSKAGALVEQVDALGHGGVLSVEFNGKPMPTPLLRQYVVQLGGRFRLTGQYRSTQLNGRDGLVWAVVCTNTGEEVARSPAMKSTAGQWETWSLDMALPSTCGRAVSVQLQTALLSESLTGLRGNLLLDSLTLEALP